MTLTSTNFASNIWNNQQLENNFRFSQINFTQQVQNPFQLQQNKEKFLRFSYQQEILKTANVSPNHRKLKKQTKKIPISKNSLCLTQNFSKVFKKNKLKSNIQQQTDQQIIQPQYNNQSWQNSYLNINAQKVKIHYKNESSLKILSTQNKQKLINQNHTCNNKTKQIFQLTQFVQKTFRQQQNQRKLKNNNHSKQCKVNFVHNHEKSYNLKQSSQEQKKQLSNTPFNQFINDLQTMSQSCLLNKFKSPTTVKTKIKRSQKSLTQTKNHQDYLKLQRTLNRALSSVCISPKNYSPIHSKKQHYQSSNILNENMHHSNSTTTTQQRHYEKLKQRVKSKVQHYKKSDPIKKSQQKQQSRSKCFSTQPKIKLIIQCNRQAVSMNDHKKNCSGSFKKHRHSTAISRTWLEYDRKQGINRYSSDFKHKSHKLFGINSLANCYRNFSANVERDDTELLIDNKSEKNIKKLKQKFYKRSQTSRLQSPPLSSRLSTAKRSMTCNQTQRNSIENIDFLKQKKLTKKQIQKEQLKEKIFEIMIDCEKENYNNVKIRQGVNIFQDYCNNVDEELKKIANEIKEYLDK